MRPTAASSANWMWDFDKQCKTAWLTWGKAEFYIKRTIHTHRPAIEAKVMHWTGRYVTKLIICSFGWVNWKTTVANQLYLVSFPCFATNDVLFAIYFMVGRITWWRMKRPTYRTASSPASRAAVKTAALFSTIKTNKYGGLLLIQMYNSFSLTPNFSKLLNILRVSSLLLLQTRLLYTRHLLVFKYEHFFMGGGGIE